MGMINELHDVNISLNQKLKDKQERENKKILQQNYNTEIKGNLQALFYNLFNKYTIQEAYKKAILEKEENIFNLTEYIENIKISKNNKMYYLYRQFDIVEDLNNNYYVILDKIKKEYTRTENIRNIELLEQLEAYLMARFENVENKSICYNVLQQKKYIDYVINDITKNKHDQEILKNNYFKTLQKVKRYYNGYILEEKEQQKELKYKQRELEKIKILILATVNIMTGELNSDLVGEKNILIIAFKL